LGLPWSWGTAGDRAAVAEPPSEAEGLPLEAELGRLPHLRRGEVHRSRGAHQIQAAERQRLAVHRGREGLRGWFVWDASADGRHQDHPGDAADILSHRRQGHPIRDHPRVGHDQRLAVHAEWGPLGPAERWRAVLPEPPGAEAARGTRVVGQSAA
jgi:hypothetical protein